MSFRAYIVPSVAERVWNETASALILSLGFMATRKLTLSEIFQSLQTRYPTLGVTREKEFFMTPALVSYRLDFPRTTDEQIQAILKTWKEFQFIVHWEEAKGPPCLRWFYDELTVEPSERPLKVLVVPVAHQLGKYHLFTSFQPDQDLVGVADISGKMSVAVENSFAFSLELGEALLLMCWNGDEKAQMVAKALLVRADSEEQGILPKLNNVVLLGRK